MARVYKSIQKIAMAYAKKQPQVIDYITEESPLISSAPMQPSTHGLRHAFAELESVTGGGFVDMDAELPSAGTLKKLNYQDLSILGCQIEVAEDTLKQLGGMPQYLADNEGAIIKTTVSTAEEQLIYNILHPYAVAQGKAVTSAAGASGNKYYSILILRWEEGNLTGLYDPKGFGQGGIFTVDALNGGNRYLDSTNVIVEGVTMKSYIGFLVNNPRNIAAIVNIDSTAVLPATLAQQISDQLIAARAGSSGRTEIWMHPALLGKLATFKDDKLVMYPSNTDVNRLVAMWDGFPIRTSYNFKQGTEGTVTIS